MPFFGGNYFMNTYTDKPGPSTAGATGNINFAVADGKYWSCQQVTLFAAASMPFPAAKPLTVLR